MQLQVAYRRRTGLTYVDTDTYVKGSGVNIKQSISTEESWECNDKYKTRNGKAL